jgi:hypothetical protein
MVKKRPPAAEVSGSRGLKALVASPPWSSVREKFSTPWPVAVKANVTPTALLAGVPPRSMMMHAPSQVSDITPPSSIIFAKFAA